MREVAKQNDAINTKEMISLPRIAQDSSKEQFKAEKAIRKGEATKTDSDCHTYKVQKGESLWSIAKKLGFKDSEIGDAIKSIAKENGIKDPSKISIGQQLRIPFEVKGNSQTLESARKDSNTGSEFQSLVKADVPLTMKATSRNDASTELKSTKEKDDVRKSPESQLVQQKDASDQSDKDVIVIDSSEEGAEAPRKGAWAKVKELAHGSWEKASNVTERILSRRPWRHQGHKDRISNLEGTHISGVASVYGTEAGDEYRKQHHLKIDGYAHQKTSSGIKMEPELPIVAHRTLPFGTKLLIECRGRQTVGVVADRGPFINGRVIDVSTSIAQQLHMKPTDSVKATVIA